MNAKILIVEDEADIREGISEYLSETGYEVIEAEDGEEAIRLFNEKNIDLIILDIMIPKLNGFGVLNKVRESSSIPVIMLTAMSDNYTQIMSFNEQADDYITKPFSIVILHKRIEAILRRSKAIEDNNNNNNVWKYKDVEVDFLGFSAKKMGVTVNLKPKEIKLLEMLLKNKNKVLTRGQILDTIWSAEEYPTDRVIDVYIKNIRKKLMIDCIVTVKGVGYKFEEE